MSNIRIDIASEFKDKGFKAAEKRTTSLNRKFDKLARTAKSTFIAIAGIQALKRSVVAFAEEDRAANKLEASLRNLGLAYDTKAIEDYLEQSEKATAISKDELSPAIAGLLSTTLDAEQSMRLLNLAMDISTSTGRDLTSVTTALSRAYNGNFASLGKLQTAYTAAELEVMGFEASVTALNDEFAGAAKNNADTYAGKIDKMKIAFGDLAEEIGAGIIAFLESLGDGDYDKGLQKLVDFGTAIGNVFRRAGLTIEYTKALLATGFRIDAGEQFKLDELRAQLANPQMGEFGINRGNLQNYARQLELQKKIVKEREKAAKLAQKDKKNQLELSKAKGIFDLEKIQIEAALQGKITEQERIRLQLMKAIANENATAVQDLVKKLKEVQEQNTKIATQLTTFPKGKDPFSDWPLTLQDIANKLLTLPKANNAFIDWSQDLASIINQLQNIEQKQIVIDFLLNYKPTLTTAIDEIINATEAALALAVSKSAAAIAAEAALSGNVALAQADALAAQAEADNAMLEAAEATEQAANALVEAITAQEVEAAQSAILAAEAATQASELLTESAAAVAAIAAAEAVIESAIIASTSANLADILAGESFASLASDNALDLNAGVSNVNASTIINVTVEGNVTAVEDLAETITDIQYEYQRTGKSPLFSSIAI